jgi:hypothetical protein
VYIFLVQEVAEEKYLQNHIFFHENHAFSIFEAMFINMMPLVHSYKVYINKISKWQVQTFEGVLFLFQVLLVCLFFEVLGIEPRVVHLYSTT